MASSHDKTRGMQKPSPQEMPMSYEETATVPADAAEVARYLANLTAEMVRLARESDLEMLAYFLEMAKIEAQISARKKHDGPGNE